MYVLVGSHASIQFQKWCEHYGNAGCLYSPPKSPNPKIPYYAIRLSDPFGRDNGKFVCWNQGRPWNADAFKRHVGKACNSPMPPQWIVVPDEVANRERTLALWNEWSQ